MAKTITADRYQVLVAAAAAAAAAAGAAVLVINELKSQKAQTK